MKNGINRRGGYWSKTEVHNTGHGNGNSMSSYLFTHSDSHLLEKAKKLLATKGFEDKHEPRKDPEDKPKQRKALKARTILNRRKCKSEIL